MVKPWNKRMSSLLDMGTGRGEAQKAGLVCQRVPWRMRSQDKQTVCCFLARAMIKWARWWRCWCFCSAFQRALCLCSSAERVCSAERESDGAWCEYELHAGGLWSQGAECNNRPQQSKDKARTLKQAKLWADLQECWIGINHSHNMETTKCVCGRSVWDKSSRLKSYSTIIMQKCAQSSLFEILFL